MELKLLQDDPLCVLASTKPVVESAAHVVIHGDRLQESAKKIARRFRQGLDMREMPYWATGDFENDAQLIFIEDVVNFCFWARRDEPRWRVEIENGKVTEGGWYGLTACFARGAKEGTPILDADYLADFSYEQARHFFRGVNGVEIPLLEERVDNLREAGRVLRDKFSGKFINVLEQSNYDAVDLVKLVIENFPSFRDVSVYQGKTIFFLKRAQILSHDFSYALRDVGRAMSNLEKLTAFADYRLPQVLRMFGVLEYSKELSDNIDHYAELLHDSPEEIEIRAATIWAVELLRQLSPGLSAGSIDTTIWLLSQSLQDGAKPYHRTRTIYY